MHRRCTTDNMNTSNAQARPVAKSTRCSRNTELQKRWLPAQIFIFMVGELRTFTMPTAVMWPWPCERLRKWTQRRRFWWRCIRFYVFRIFFGVSCSCNFDVESAFHIVSISFLILIFLQDCCLQVCFHLKTDKLVVQFVSALYAVLPLQSVSLTSDYCV